MSTEINIKKRIDIQEEGVSITSDVNSINFTGAGVTASSIGDDVTVDITAAAGTVLYYMNQTINQLPYKDFSSTGTTAVEQVVPATVAGGTTATIVSFQTPSGVPNTTVIPQGLWQLFLHFNATTAGQNWIIRPYVYKRDLGGTETLIFTPDPVVVTNMNITTEMYLCDGVFPTTTLFTTDRIVVKIDIQNTTGASQTVNFRTEGSQHYSVATTTLNQVIPTGAVTSVTGTAPVVSSGGTTPAISMPAANGTTNGYLTSADWTTFNNKVDKNIYSADGTLAGNRQLNLGTYSLDILSTNTSSAINLNIDDGTTSTSIIQDVNGLTFNAIGTGSGKVLQINENQIYINGLYNLPVSSAPLANQIIYASSINQLNFTSLKTVNSNSLIGSGNISVGTVTSVGLSTGTTGTDVNVSGSPVTGSSSITLNIPTASATNTGKLSSTDWSTFNGKQNAITLTTTGTSGAATLIGSTLNIPQYAGGLSFFTEAQSTAAPNATVNVDSLTAVASTTNADFAIVPKGTGAIIAAIPDNTATGGNKRGTNATDFQTLRNAATQVASGPNSILLGVYGAASGPNSLSISLGNTSFSAAATQTKSIAIGGWTEASANNAVALGERTRASSSGAFAVGGYGFVETLASGNYSVAIGGGNTASSDFSTAIGGVQNTSSGFASYAMGASANTFGITGRNSYGFTVGNSDGSGSVSGNCQKSTFPLGVRTTNGTATTLTVGGQAASGGNQVILSNQSAYRFKGTIIGKQSGSTNIAAWDVDGLIVRGANAAATTLVVSNVNLVSNTPSWGTPTLAADTTNGGLRVQVIGAATTNIQWTATIETTEVIYS